MMKSKYEFKKDVLGRKLNVKLVGRFTEKKGFEYIEDYNKEIASITNRDSYTLSVDCNELALPDSKTTDALTYCFSLYKEAGFKEVEFIVSDNPHKFFFKTQFKRLGRNSGLEFKMVD